MQTKCLSKQKGKLDMPCLNFFVLTDLKRCVCGGGGDKELTDGQVEYR